MVEPEPPQIVVSLPGGSQRTLPEGATAAEPGESDELSERRRKVEVAT